MVAGTVYMLAAPLMTWLQAPAGSVFAIYPWLLAATHWFAIRGSPRAAAAVAAATTLTILAGHPESSLAAISGAAVYLVVLLAFRARADLRDALSVGTRWLLAALLGVAGAAVVVLPFEGFLADSVTKATHGSTAPIPFYAVLQFLAPRLFGDAQPHTYGFAFSLTPVAGYFGVPALMLAVAAVWRHPRAPATAGLAATALAAGMANFGIAPVSWWTSHVPPWSDALMAGRVYFMIALPAAVGAGAGYAALTDRRMRPRGVAIVAAGVAAVTLVAFALAQARGLLEAPAPVRRDALLLAGAAIAAGAALLAGLGRLRAPLMLAATVVVAAVSVSELRGYNVILDPALAHPETPPSLRYLQARDWPFRVQPIREGGNMLNPNILAEHGLEALEGYDFPLDHRWSDFQAGALRYGGLLPERRVMVGQPEGAALTALRLFNVRYYVADPGAGPPKGFETVYDDADATVFRDPGALPRAFVVGATRPLSDAAALKELGRAGFDPRRVALVPEDSPRPATGGAYAPARVERLAPDHLRVHLDGTPGWLVVGNAYSEFWEAKVDGESADLHPTDFAAMGLPVTAAAKTVDIELDRTRPAIGALISLLALAGMGVLAFRRQR